MARNIDPTLLAALSAENVSLAVFAALTFRTGTQYCWTGVGSYVWNGKTFLGVGSLGKIGDITDGGESNAQGVQVQLSGLDATWLADVQTEIRQSAPAKLWLAAMTEQMQLIGTPYMMFRGIIDKADVQILPPTPEGDGQSSITLNLESRLINHARPNARRYTSADQRANGYPDDTSLDWVEQLNDAAFVEGQ